MRVLISVILGALPLMMMAQDDLYFTPKKSVKEAKSSVERIDDDAPVYYSGSDRSDDEYNRLGEYGSYYEVVGTDSLGNDIIEFHPGKGYSQQSEDSKYDEGDDYEYSRRMSRFDDWYCSYDPWFYTHYGFGPYWRSRFYWDSYYPWYTGWYDPWYYGYGYGYYGWYNPWYYSWYYPYYGWGYGYYGWGYPYYFGGGSGGHGYWAHNDRNHGITGTSNHGDVYRPGRGGHSGGVFSGARGGTTSTRSGNTGGKSKKSGTFGGNRTYSDRQNSSSRSSRNSDIISSTRSGGGAQTVGSSHGSYGSSGSFGGSHSGGSFGGGGGSTHSSGGGGGGGHFGGRR